MRATIPTFVSPCYPGRSSIQQGGPSITPSPSLGWALSPQSSPLWAPGTTGPLPCLNLPLPKRGLRKSPRERSRVARGDRALPVDGVGSTWETTGGIPQSIFAEWYAPTILARTKPVRLMVLGRGTPSR